MMARLNRRHPVLGFRLKGAVTAEIIPAVNDARPASYTLPVASTSMAAVGDLIEQRINEDNARDMQNIDVGDLASIFNSA